ncbi:hypothetical protein [Bacteroides sp.]|uniref:hypothetical protein n=1 Tax=Bacteroides sp. TaxID=29523 RepID=UPI0025C0D406|nr:hypothetical protein [Bacteroides sp.]
MKYINIVIIFFFISHTVSAQDSKTSIYEYGSEIQTCEDNFNNLFRNWTPNVVETANDLQLLSYEFVEELNTYRKIKRYTKWFSNPNTIGNTDTRIRYTKSSYSLETGKATSNYKQWMTIVRYGDKLSTKELKKLKDKVKSRIKIGDKVYTIKYKYEGIEHIAFTICCPLTNKVVWDNMFQTIMVYSKFE